MNFNIIPSYMFDLILFRLQAARLRLLYSELHTEPEQLSQNSIFWETAE